MVALRLIFLLIGFTAVIAQVVFLRELLVLFGGSEISLGLMLSAWLLWTAFGSGVLGRVGRGRPRRAAAVLNLVLAVAFPLTVFSVRILKPALSATPGELVGPGGMLVASLLAFGPFCAASGWLFSAAARLYKIHAGEETAAATSMVYLMDAAGSALGGLLASLLLIRSLSPMAIALVVASMNLFAGAWLLSTPRIAVVPALLCASAIPWVAPRLERTSLEKMWAPFPLAAVHNSIYGNLALTERAGSRLLYENGAPLFQVPDPEMAERSVHYALLQHPAPRSLLLIGGGVGGALDEALKHPTLESVDYVELDPAVVRLAQTHLGFRPPPSIRLHFTDGRAYLKTAGERFDVIILNLPEPQTAQLNRFYTAEFFAEAAARLNPGGVLSFGLASSENYISPARAAFLRCIYGTLRSVFPETVFLPGSTIRFFASNRPGVLTSDAAVLLNRLQRRGIQTLYVSPAYLPFELTPDRFEPVARALSSEGHLPLNRDFAPAAYYFGAVLWAARFDPRSARWLERASSLGFGAVFWTAVVVAWGWALLLCWRRRPAAIAAYAVFSTGAGMMALEILLLLGFQAIYGYVYSKLAILIAMFMAGMSLGSRAALRGRASLYRLAQVQALIAVAPLLLCLAMELQAGAAGATLVFPIMAASAGFLGGVQFPVASRVFFPGSEKEEEHAPGSLYAADLAGACFGAISSSVFLIPLFGFKGAAEITGLICLAPVLPALLHARRRPEP